MADPKKYTAHINRKGLDSTGVTEDHVRGMVSRLGNSTMIVAEARHEAYSTDAEGNISLTMVLTNVEPVPADLDERVREFQRALYRKRPEVEGQEVLRGADGGEPDLEQAADALNPEVWDGNTEAPLRSVPTGPDFTGCDFPGCTLEAEHDGDHATDSEDE